MNNKQEIYESSINRILSHMEDKDMAMITAFRTDPELGLSNKDNEERNKKLESDLNVLGYKGYTKVIGFWNETPDIPESKPTREETFLVLNVGNRDFNEFLEDMVGLQLRYDQQGIMLWNHEDKKAYLTGESGNIVDTLSNFSINDITKGWTQIKGHKLSFSEAYENVSFSDTFNKGGNWITAMWHDAKRKALRKETK